MSTTTESIEQALTDCVRAAGGHKRVGSHLRPELDPDVAGRWLADGLNADRREKLDIRQVLVILRLGREVGCHVGMEHIATTCGYAQPHPISNQSELAELHRRLASTMENLQPLVDRLNSLCKDGSI